MKTPAFLMAVAALLPSAPMAQPPNYHAEFLGEFFVTRMNESTQMIGVSTSGGAQRGFVVSAGQQPQNLPLPDGMHSSHAVAISDVGVIVGAVSASLSPEFGGQAVAWHPDGNGGYSVELLSALPGQTLSRATAVNNIGDILGYSSDGQYRYPVLFTAPGGVMDLSATGIFDPADVNDRRLVVDHSFTVKRLDLNSMTVEDLGVPPGSYLATTASVINESDQVAGLAILTSSDNCDRVAARYTNGAGWEIFSGCGQHNSATDMNDRGDLVMRLNVAPYVYFEGLGTYRIEDLIVSQTGHWYVLNGFGLAINNAQQLVVSATNPTTGQTGTLLLTPESPVTGVGPDTPADTAALLLLNGAPNPFNPRTTLRLVLPTAGYVRLSVLGVDGGLIRVLVDESRSEGDYAVIWDGQDRAGHPVAAGVYLARLEAGGEVITQKLVLAK